MVSSIAITTVFSANEISGMVVCKAVNMGEVDRNKGLVPFVRLFIADDDLDISFGEDGEEEGLVEESFVREIVDGDEFGDGTEGLTLERDDSIIIVEVDEVLPVVFPPSFIIFCKAGEGTNTSASGGAKSAAAIIPKVRIVCNSGR
jgi:hypothetical protein